MLSANVPRGLYIICWLSLALARAQGVVESSQDEDPSVQSTRDSARLSVNHVHGDDVALTPPRACDTSEWEVHPVLCELVMRAEKDVESFAHEAYQWAEDHHQLVGASFLKGTMRIDSIMMSPVVTSSSGHLAQDANSKLNAFRSSLTVNQLPVVFAHGMGDSCFNSGFQHIVQKVADMLQTYAVCIPIGDTQGQDTKNGYFLSMDDSVDIFASKISHDERLQHGFHAIGFSQGANVIRGYMARFNDPAVHTFLSVNGVNAGVGAVPYCRPSSTATVTASLRGSFVATSMCDLLMEQASRAAYTHYAQQHSFQANYWRDPRPSEQETYRTYSQLAAWNNEVSDPALVNETLKINWAKTSKFVWVLASDDEMVWPKEGEHWGAPDPTDPFERVLPRTETEWYTNDLFGLRTAEEQGKNAYETFEGDHLQFSEEDFDRWINTYLRQQSSDEMSAAQ